MNIEDVLQFFRDPEEAFTVHVVEQRFAVGRGSEYFRSYKGKENYIDSNAHLVKRIAKILGWINKRIPDSADLIKSCMNAGSPLGIVDIITSLSKLLGTHQHQAAGPDVVDPIIIQEGNVLPKYIKQVISLHKESILKPIIIVILRDNDFERAKELLTGCPHGTNIKLIRNSGKTEMLKVINCGAKNVDDFLEAFSLHCFSTCSQTPRNILLNEGWEQTSIVRKYSPLLLQVRTNFLYGEKEDVRDDLTALISQLSTISATDEKENKLVKSFECMARLFRVYCNDSGGDDITEAHAIARSLGQEVLLAHVYRYSFFMNQLSFSRKLELLDKAYEIFTKDHIEDHAIYSRNNRIIRQLDTETLNLQDFRSLQQEAIYNVPGLVEMSQILNNTGVAHLMAGYPEDAIQYFRKGLDYASQPERCVQKIALLGNELIAKVYCFDAVSEKDIRRLLNLIFDNMGLSKLPFISARYAMNLVAIAFHEDPELGKELLSTYPIAALVHSGFERNIIASGQLALQMNVLSNRYRDFDLLQECPIPNQLFDVSGLRKQYIIRYGFNPFFFSTWL